MVRESERGFRFKDFVKLRYNCHGGTWKNVGVVLVHTWRLIIFSCNTISAEKIIVLLKSKTIPQLRFISFKHCLKRVYDTIKIAVFIVRVSYIFINIFFFIYSFRICGTIKKYKHKNVHDFFHYSFLGNDIFRTFLWVNFKKGLTISLREFFWLGITYSHITPCANLFRIFFDFYPCKFGTRPRNWPLSDTEQYLPVTVMTRKR